MPPRAAVKKLAINAWATMDSSGASLSAGNAKLQFDALLAQRPSTGAAFCPGHSPLLLTAYAPVGAQLGAAALLQVRAFGGPVFPFSHGYCTRLTRSADFGVVGVRVAACPTPTTGVPAGY